MSAIVMTVLGPVAPEALGVTDAHTHAWIERVVDGDASAPLLTDRALLEARLAEYAAAGGSALVDCQPGGCGRNARVAYTLWPAPVFTFGATTALVKRCGI